MCSALPVEIAGRVRDNGGEAIECSIVHARPIASPYAFVRHLVLMRRCVLGVTKQELVTDGDTVRWKRISQGMSVSNWRSVLCLFVRTDAH